MRNKKRERNWLSPLSIPEGKVGEYQIKHQIIPAGQGVMFNSFRNAMFGRQKGPQQFVYDVDTRWHRLEGPTGTWMTDLPVEQRQMEECLRGMKGRILVGGLGLGLATQILAKKKEVKEIFVVEISNEVVDLVYKHLKRKFKIVLQREDLFSFLSHWHPLDIPFDYAFYDIWQSDGEGTFFETVVPLLQASEGIVKHRPICWNEQVMRGQLQMSLINRLHLLRPEFDSVRDQMGGFDPWNEVDSTQPGTIYHNRSVLFFQWWKEEKERRRSEKLNEKKVAQMARFYSAIYGEAGWKEKWQSKVAEISTRSAHRKG